jgi:hypothetical protein
MNPDPPNTQRVSDILGRHVHDGSGRPLGRIADLATERDPDGTERITAAIVVKGRWGRLLGYERDEGTGPWILEKLAGHVLRRDTTRVAWHDLRF